MSGLRVFAEGRIKTGMDKVFIPVFLVSFYRVAGTVEINVSFDISLIEIVQPGRNLRFIING
jgi:hypothetical protein